MADFPWTCERQPLEHRPVPVRVSDLAKPLGAADHGPVHAADRRLRHPCRHRGWQSLVLHVQPCHSRACDAEVPQLRQRSAVPVLLMAGQPAGAVCDRDQECSLCSDVASVCRTVDRHPATRMLGLDTVLVRARPGTETVRIPGLLQCSSGACVVGRTDASPETEGCRNAQPLPLGRALPRTLSDADRRLKSGGEDAGWWVASPVFDVPRWRPSRNRRGRFSSTSYARHADRVEDDSGSPRRVLNSLLKNNLGPIELLDRTRLLFLEQALE